ncbi:MAG: hypothetical protein J2P15_17960, partial [Micromonosporaceae bacterium]|nr:hypothetical protein [Micromonosporaceae bacterium]
MKLPKHVANPSLAVLIELSGFPSLDAFAEAVNRYCWERHGLRLCYDHIRIRRWLAGGRCQYPDAVAAVLGRAWGLPIPVAAIWPDLRDGQPPDPVHLQPWVAARTVENLGTFLRSDMLTRRDMIAGTVAATAGAPFADPLARWLRLPAVGLPGPAG